MKDVVKLYKQEKSFAEVPQELIEEAFANKSGKIHIKIEGTEPGNPHCCSGT